MNLTRRTLLGALAAAGVAHATRLPAALGRQPSLLTPFDGVSHDLPAQPLTVTGAIPASCHGTLYRNGPALFARNGQRYQHWFDPDGMIQAFRLDSAGINHRGRFVRTSKFVSEEAAGRFLYNGAGSIMPGAQPARSNATTNVANINIQPVGGELLALWEAGMPYRLDPESLDTLGQPDWDPALAGVPFSAHPKFDENGELWNIGSIPFAGSPKLVLYHVGRDGALNAWKLHELDFAGYMHDFILTPDYLIALNSSAVFGDGNTFVDRMHWQPEQASQLLVFARSDLSLVRSIDVPATFVFHFGNAWQHGSDILFTACQHPDSAIVTRGMRRLALQEPGPYDLGATLVRYRLSVKAGTAQVEPLGVAMEFPAFDTRKPFVHQPLFGAGEDRVAPGRMASAVHRVDPETGHLTAFDYGTQVVVEEPLFVPGPDGGHVMHTLFDIDRQQTGLAILRADSLTDGPVALAYLPPERVLPYGFHGCFVAG